MSFVQSYLKEPCPCGDKRCKAIGNINPKTGHSRKCWPGCPKCARGEKPRGTSRKIPDLVKRKVRSRSGGRCEVRMVPDGPRCEFDAEHMHHRRRRSQGGRDSESNLLDVCSTHHQLIHDQPAWAMDRGYLIGNEPISSAVTSVTRIEGPPRPFR